jgi:hypothetical protein
MPLGGCLCAKLGPAFSTTCIQNVATGLRGHTRTKPVTPFADQVRWLKCALHVVVSVICNPNPRGVPRPCLIRSPVFRRSPVACQFATGHNIATNRANGGRQLFQHSLKRPCVLNRIVTNDQWRVIDLPARRQKLHLCHSRRQGFVRNDQRRFDAK